MSKCKNRSPHPRSWRENRRMYGVPGRYYRSNDDRIVAGVCGGIAEYLGADTIIVRLIAFASMFFFGPLAFLIYIGIWYFVPTRPESLYENDENAAFQNEVRKRPQEGLRHLKYRFSELDRRIQNLERHVTSTRYRFDKELGEKG